MDLMNLNPNPDPTPTKFYDSRCIFPSKPVFSKIAGMDTETHLITDEEPVPPLVCITLSDNRIYGGTKESKTQGILAFFDLLEDADTMVVGHNIFFDLEVIIKAAVDLGIVTSRVGLEQYIWGMIKVGKIRDTGVLGRLIAIKYDWLRFDPVTRAPAEFSLEVMLQRHCNIRLKGKHEEDAWRFRYKELDGVPLSMWPQAAISYAKDDAILAATLYEFLNRKYTGHPDEIFQVESAWVMHKMSVWGIHTDSKNAADLEAKINPIIEEAQASLIDKGFLRKGEIKVDRDYLKELVRKGLGDKTPLTAGGEISLSEATLRKARHPLLNAYLALKDDKEGLLELGLAHRENPTKDTEAIRRAVKEYYDDPPLTDKGQISIDRATIEQVPELEELAKIGEFEKIKSTYLPIFKAGKILHARWNPLVASGRVSVSNPNLNNMPRGHGVRECFRARDGYVFISADYSQAELCSLAQICLDKFGFSHMADAINANKDLHLVLAAQIENISYEEMYAKYKADDQRAKDLRQMAKAANFGFPGGLGPDKFVDYAFQSYKVKITREEAVHLRAVWLSTYPEVQLYFKWVKGQLQSGKYFDFIQHRSGRIRGRVGFCDGCNTGFQGLTADGAKYAKNMISYEMYCEEKSPLFGCGINAFIYDELLIEAPIEKAHEAAMRLQELMIQGMQVFTPGVITKVEVDMMYNWSKKAKAVYENGRLVPFDKDRHGPSK